MTEPKELIDQLDFAGLGPVDRDVVEEIIAQREACLPLLLEVTHDDVDETLLARALALIGEIGDASLLTEVTAFFADADEDEDAVSECAEWAARRLARRLPTETLAEIARLSATGDILQLCDLLKVLMTMHGASGRSQALLGFAPRLNDLDEDDRPMLAVSMAMAAMFVDGPRSELVKQVRQLSGKYIIRDAEEVLKEAERELTKKPVDPNEPDSDVFELVCSGFDEEMTGTYEREEPKVGRNDPCPCGSGKKYKKCHGA